VKLNFIERVNEGESIDIDAISLPSDALKSGEFITASAVSTSSTLFNFYLKSAIVIICLFVCLHF